MSRRSFFTKRLPFFGNRAMLILCVVFFLLPFILRGAKEGVNNIKNDVSDWLPSSFKETQELGLFRDYFLGDQFVVVTWEGCNEDDNRFGMMRKQIIRESLVFADEERARLAKMDPATEEYQELKENLDAKDWATEMALHTTGNDFSDWGQHNEKWLMGKNRQWYFIRTDGSIFKWNGQNNLIDAGSRATRRFLTGENDVDGTFVKRFGKPVNNRFHKNPDLICARFFTEVTTGPDVFERMAGVEGMMILGQYGKDEKQAFEAQIETHKRLTGVLFGPTPSPEFDWTLNSFIQVLPELRRPDITKGHEFEFQKYINELVTKEYDNDIANLRDAPPSKKLEHWYRLFRHLDVEPPPRQTCLIVTLNDPVLDELSRAVGRPVLGKPRGRLLAIASGICGINPENLHLGGPPVDNVAIDEEGSITLFRLVGLSAFIGISLAWLSFRSIRITAMLFFVGGVSAIASLSIVYFLGGTMDAILMTMPSLVYVLGLSGAVHVVNYYRDACKEYGEGRAADVAVAHGLFPCALAAFTTALGLISLCTSNLTPINKFGFYSAIATVATVILLFTYLPSSLTIWPPGYGKKRKEDEAAEDDENTKLSITKYVEMFWDKIGLWVVKHNKLVFAVGVGLMITFAIGLTRIETSVQLLKLFRNDAKILKDYRWMEENLGKLVPMELMLKVDGDVQLRKEEIPNPPTDADLNRIDFKLSFLERMELSDRIRRYVLNVFGDESIDENRRYIGNVMSTDLQVPLSTAVRTQLKGHTQRVMVGGELEANREQLRKEGYLQVDKQSLEEYWRISLRLAALNNVDYGQFIGELKTVVEPCLAAYRYRLMILKSIHEQFGDAAHKKGQLLVLTPRYGRPKSGKERHKIGLTEDLVVDQTGIFCDTLHDLLQNSGFRTRQGENRRLEWSSINPDKPLTEKVFETLANYDIVVVVDPTLIDMASVRKYAKKVIVTDGFRYDIELETKQALAGMLTAAELKEDGDVNALITSSYTGIVPIVYKAQRSLLKSLIQSIALAFVMIAIVMMLLLRPWGRKVTMGNALNFRAGMIAMIPNVFPIVIIFGAMGHFGRLVDIGSMMTASVAMGVAVDDTIHFLNWFRQGIGKGMDRLSAIRLAYSKVATAMTQTTLIAGFGLSAFAFSTFMPTQRFGILMLFLLVAALIGDLILLPAILASPLGKYFCNLDPKEESNLDLDDEFDEDGAGKQEAMDVDDAEAEDSPAMINFTEQQMKKKRG